MRLGLYFEFFSKDNRAEAEKLPRGCGYWRHASVEKEKEKKRRKRKWKKKKKKKVVVVVKLAPVAS